MILFGWHVWRGDTGHRYRFKITLTKAGLPKDGVGGIYVMVRRRFVFFLEPLYVGKATDLRSRLLGHEKWGRAYWFYGATERHVMAVETEAERSRVEEDLIRRLKPRMNDMMVRKRSQAPSDRALRREWAMRRWWRGEAFGKI